MSDTTTPEASTVPASPPTYLLHVSDVDPSAKVDKLREVFGEVDGLVDVRLYNNVKAGKHLAYAHIEYSNEENGKEAMNKLNYTKFGKRHCHIMRYNPDEATRESNVGNIFIDNLDKENITNQVLRGLFEEYGEINSCKLAEDDEGRSMGHGFVRYDDPKSAELAIEKANGTERFGRKILVEHRKSKGRPAKTDKPFTNVFVKNLSPEVTEDEFKRKFAEVGQITSAILGTGSGQENKYGFVNYENAAAAKEAIRKFDGVEHWGKVLYVSEAKTREEWKKELEGKKPNDPKKSRVFYQIVDKGKDEELDATELCKGPSLDELTKQFEVIGHVKFFKFTFIHNPRKIFGSVYYSSPKDAARCIAEMNDKAFGSKILSVSHASPRSEVQKGSTRATEDSSA